MSDNGPRRDPATVLAAHRIDPKRRELYVEGSDDRHFLKWLIGNDRDSETSIREIASVSIDSSDGQRGRAVAFAEHVVDSGAQIRVLVDSDFDRLLARELPTNCWRTDFRDMEAYFFRSECIQKVWSLAAQNEEIDADAALNAVLAAARTLGLLRLLSEQEGHKFSFQKTNLKKRTSATKNSITLDVEGFVRSLLQNGKEPLGLSRLDEILTKLEALEAADPQPACDLAHGHDCVELLERLLSANGVDASADDLLRTSFEPWMADQHPILSEVLEWLRGVAAVIIGASVPSASTG